MLRIKNNWVNKRLIIVLILAVCLGTERAHSQTSDFAKAVMFVKEKKYANAAKIFMKLADQNDPDAQFNLALLLRKGLGYPSNYSLALEWSWISQLNGITKANALTEELLGLVPDETQDLVREKILKRLQLRIENGERSAILPKAQFHLTVSREADYATAYALRALAAALDLDGAMNLRNEIEVEVEPEDLIKAQMQAGEMFKTIVWQDKEK